MKPNLPSLIALFALTVACYTPHLSAQSDVHNVTFSDSHAGLDDSYLQAMMNPVEKAALTDEVDLLLGSRVEENIKGSTANNALPLTETPGINNTSSRNEYFTATPEKIRTRSDSSGGTTLDTSLEAEETPRTSLVNNPTADTNSLSADNSDYRQNKLQSKINEFFAAKNNQNINKNRELLNSFKLALQKEYGIPAHALAIVLTNAKEDQIIAYGLTNDLENEIKERTVAYQRARLSEDIEEIDNEAYYRTSDEFERLSNYQNDKNDVKGFQQDFKKLADFKTILKQNYGKHGENVFTPEEEQQALVDGLTLELKEQVARKAVNNQVTALAQKIEEAQKAVAKAEKKMANITEERTDYEDDLGWQYQQLIEARTNFLLNPFNKELSLAYTQASKTYEDFLKETDEVTMKSGEEWMRYTDAKSTLRVSTKNLDKIIEGTPNKLLKVIQQERPTNELSLAIRKYNTAKEALILAEELKVIASQFSEKEKKYAALQEASNKLNEAKNLIQLQEIEIKKLGGSI